MNTEILDLQDDLVAFRQAVRDFVRRTCPPQDAHKWMHAKGQDQVDIQKWWMDERRKVGLATAHWPKEYGGAGLSLAHQIIIADEFVRGNTPESTVFTVATNHVPATLIPYGTEYQKKKYLPGVAEGTIWCQGFSEPGAGSDLASLKTRAVRDGDHYVINGQKIWSSSSMYARYAILLARTDPDARKQRGISYFLLDMQSPGVEVRPIKKSTGASTFGEIFLTDVRIPVEERVGEENQGWTVAQATLASERGVLVFNTWERENNALQNYYRRALEGNAPWLEDAELRREFMRLFACHQAVRRQIRVLLKESHQEGVFSLTPAFVKLLSTDTRNKLTQLLVRIEGLSGQAQQPPREFSEPVAMYDYLDSYGGTIAAGSNEIMRNLIAERGLGMPR